MGGVDTSLGAPPPISVIAMAAIKRAFTAVFSDDVGEALTLLFPEPPTLSSNLRSPGDVSSDIVSVLSEDSEGMDVTVAPADKRRVGFCAGGEDCFMNA